MNPPERGRDASFSLDESFFWLEARERKKRETRCCPCAFSFLRPTFFSSRRWSIYFEVKEETLLSLPSSATFPFFSTKHFFCFAAPDGLEKRRGRRKKGLAVGLEEEENEMSDCRGGLA